MLLRESDGVELKSIYVDDIKKEILAFVNTHGGIIYIGVEDDGTICGVPNAEGIIEQVLNSARDGIKPNIMGFINVEIVVVDGKQVVSVQVQRGTHRPYYLGIKGLRPEGVFVRQGTSSVPATEFAIREMIKETDGENYEDMRSIEQHLTFDKLRTEFRKRGLTLEHTQMKTLGLIDSEDLYTNLALILSDQCPHIMKAASFAGVNQEQFQDRREFTGSLLQQLEDAYAYLNMRNQNAATFDGLLRIDHRDYPDVAIRESLLNTIVHRDYALSASTLLSVYSNRMEFISIGGLAGSMTYEDMMLGVSYCRNNKLANIFYRMNLIEAYGTGISKIQSSYEKSEAKPQILVSTGAFKVILPKQVEPFLVIKKQLPPTGEQKKREEVVLSVLSDQACHSRLELEQALGLSTSTTRRILQELIEKGKIVSCCGNRKNVLYKLAMLNGK